MREYAAVSPNVNVDYYLPVNSFYVILNHLKHSYCYTLCVSSFNLMKICILLKEWINAFNLILRTSSDYFSKEH
jgi:hypothetical protein